MSAVGWLDGAAWGVEESEEEGAAAPLGVSPRLEPWQAPEPEPEPEPELQPAPHRSVPAHARRSDWTLFGCERRRLQFTHGGQGDGTSELVRYYLDNGTRRHPRHVAVEKPLSGEGTALLHGDYGRRISPSAEGLAWHLVQQRALLGQARVLELGAGLGLAGLAAAVWSDAAAVDLTDGDPAVVATLQRTIAHNDAACFGSTQVSARLLEWEVATPEPLSDDEKYDVIIAADTVYQKESHAALLSTIRRLLKPRGSVLLMASRRNGSLDTFIAAANTGVAAFPFVGVSVDWEGSVAFSSMKCAPVLVRMASPVVAKATTVTSSAKRVRKPREESKRSKPPRAASVSGSPVRAAAAAIRLARKAKALSAPDLGRRAKSVGLEKLAVPRNAPSERRRPAPKPAAEAPEPAPAPAPAPASAAPAPGRSRRTKARKPRASAPKEDDGDALCILCRRAFADMPLLQVGPSALLLRMASLQAHRLPDRLSKRSRA